MNTKITITKILVFCLIIGLFINYLKIFGQSQTAIAVGELTIDWGVAADEPLFKIANLQPDQTISKTVKITNNSLVTKSLALRATKKFDPAGLASVLSITITDNHNFIYNNNFNNFFNDSQDLNGINLFSLGGSQTKELNFSVTLDSNAAYDFQGRSLIFDLQIGAAFNLPPACKGRNYQKIIYGTSQDDRLYGSNKNDLIIGFEGEDQIFGLNGDDCLIGGFGNDRLYGSNGNDILYGEEGNDFLSGSNGNDQLYGGNGNDFLTAGNGQDFLDGQEDKDKADGGPGLDACVSEKTNRCEK